MYRFIGSHVYPEGRTYYGFAMECQYSFYAAKDFDISQIYDHIINRSDSAAGEKDVAMLTNKVWVDQTGVNNRFLVNFKAHSSGGASGISGISGLQIVVVMFIIKAILIAAGIAAIIYAIHALKEISYSPVGKEMWSAIKWVGIGIVAIGVVAVVPLIQRVLPKKEEKVA